METAYGFEIDFIMKVVEEGFEEVWVGHETYREGGRPAKVCKSQLRVLTIAQQDIEKEIRQRRWQAQEPVP